MSSLSHSSSAKFQRSLNSNDIGDARHIVAMSNAHSDRATDTHPFSIPAVSLAFGLLNRKSQPHQVACSASYVPTSVILASNLFESETERRIDIRSTALHPGANLSHSQYLQSANEEMSPEKLQIYAQY